MACLQLALGDSWCGPFACACCHLGGRACEVQAGAAAWTCAVKLKVARALCCACVDLYGCAGECVVEAQQGVQGVGQSKSALGRGAWQVRGCCNIH
jgi:hypothetical protein